MQAIRFSGLSLRALAVSGLVSMAILWASVATAEPLLKALPAEPESSGQSEMAPSMQSGDVEEERELREAIAAMVDAMAHGTYGGRFIHMRGDQLDLMRVIHRYVDGQRIELMVAENGEVREIRRLGDRCACVWPQREQVMLGGYPNMNSRLSGERFESLTQSPSNYRMIDLGHSRVAGRACRMMAVVPRDELRYGYKLCIGESMPLLLRMSIYDESGRPIEHNQFTEVEAIESVRLTFQEELTAGLEDGYERIELSGEPIEDAPIRQQRWVIDPLPAGFDIRSRGWRRNPVTGQYFEHMVVSDGLATASVFVEKRDGDAARQVTRTDQGMTVAARSVDSVRITAIGDVPAATVEWLVEHTVRDPLDTPGDGTQADGSP